MIIVTDFSGHADDNSCFRHETLLSQKRNLLLEVYPGEN